MESRKKPKDLLDMEHVYADKLALTPGQRYQAALKNEDRWKFQAALTAAQNGYRAHLRGLEKKVPGPTTGVADPVDEVTGSLEELIEKLLARADREAEE